MISSGNAEIAENKEFPAPFPGRVALFVKGFGPGGVERIALRLAEAWQAAGIDVTLTVATRTGPMQHPSTNCRIASPWPWLGHRWPMLRLAFSLWRDLRQDLRRDPPAILFCPGNAYTVVAIFLKLALGRRCPLIVAKVSNDLIRRDMHGAVRPLYRQWLRIQGRMLDHFAVLSSPMGDEVVALMRISRSQVHVVPNPVLAATDLAAIGLAAPDLAAAGPERQPPGSGRRFVAVGRLERQKDYPAMLHAFAAGAGRTDSLTIYGAGRALPSIRALAGSLGLEDRVHLAGHHADMRGRLREYDILLLSSRYEGQPGAVVEALSVGLGVIATRCCASMAELLDHGALGTLVDVGDTVAFAHAIANARPGTQDRRRALAKASGFTIEKAVPAYFTLFATIVAQRQEMIGARRRPSVPATIARHI